MRTYFDVLAEVCAFLEFLLVFLHDVLRLLELVSSVSVPMSSNA